MREIVFRVIREQPGHLEAQAEHTPITISAPSLEELHHEAREALIQHLGPAHVSVRVRIRRGHRGNLPKVYSRVRRTSEGDTPNRCLKAALNSPMCR